MLKRLLQLFAVRKLLQRRREKKARRRGI